MYTAISPLFRRTDSSGPCVWIFLKNLLSLSDYQTLGETGFMYLSMINVLITSIKIAAKSVLDKKIAFYFSSLVIAMIQKLKIKFSYYNRYGLCASYLKETSCIPLTNSTDIHLLLYNLHWYSHHFHLLHSPLKQLLNGHLKGNMILPL